MTPPKKENSSVALLSPACWYNQSGDTQIWGISPDLGKQQIFNPNYETEIIMLDSPNNSETFIHYVETRISACFACINSRSCGALPRFALQDNQKDMEIN